MSHYDNCRPGHCAICGQTNNACGHNKMNPEGETGKVPKTKATTHPEEIVRNAIRNIWNMGGLVGIADIDSASQEALAQVAEENALAEIEKALDICIRDKD